MIAAPSALADSAKLLLAAEAPGTNLPPGLDDLLRLDQTGEVRNVMQDPGFHVPSVVAGQIGMRTCQGSLHRPMKLGRIDETEHAALDLAPAGSRK